MRDQYKEMRDEFMAGLEDRKYLTIDQVRAKACQVILHTVPDILWHGMVCAVLPSCSSVAKPHGSFAVA